MEGYTMARQKAKTLEERIEANENDILLAKETLNELHEERKQLLNQKKEEDLKLLIQTLEITGFDVNEAVNILKEKSRDSNKEDSIPA